MLRYRSGELFIERVYAFDYYRVIFLNADPPSLLTPACFEIEMRERDLFSVYEIEKVAIEAFDIKTVYMLKIDRGGSGILNAADVVAVAVIVVHRDHNGINTARKQLYAQTVAECRLAARAGTRNADETYIFNILFNTIT